MPRLKLTALLAIALLVELGTAGCVGVRNATSMSIGRVAVVRLYGLPADAKPIRISLLSDVHVGNFAMRFGPH